MDKVLVVFGSTNGNTEDAAQLISEQLGGSATVENVADLNDASGFLEYDLLLLGTSTWGEGDLQDDWEDFIDKLDSVDLSRKKVALFGLGDQSAFGHVFVNGIRIIYDKVTERGATVIGHWKDEGYDYEASEAVIDGQFVGLPLDADNQDDLTVERVRAWLQKVKSEAA